MLAKMGKANNSKCEVCNVEDYLEHFFFNCKTVRNIWSEINTLVFEETNKHLDLHVTDVIFGFYKRSKIENDFINKLIIIGKLCISKFKYGKHPNLIFLFKNELEIRKWIKIN